jgi:hypothetical protein
MANLATKDDLEAALLRLTVRLGIMIVAVVTLATAVVGFMLR